MLCNSNEGMVDALTKKYPNKFKMDSRKAEDHRMELQEHGIESHGVVCVQDGKILWKKVDHKMSQAELDAGLKLVLSAID